MGFSSAQTITMSARIGPEADYGLPGQHAIKVQCRWSYFLKLGLNVFFRIKNLAPFYSIERRTSLFLTFCHLPFIMV